MKSRDEWSFTSGEIPTLLPNYWNQIAFEPNTGCWLWFGRTEKSGYGAIRRNGVAYKAHRLFYAAHNGLIPKGMVLDHLCRQRCCVNPDHLEIVTHRTNVLRGNSSKRTSTHCQNGHLLTPDNIYVSKGCHDCLTCRRERSARYNAKVKARRLAKQHHLGPDGPWLD